MKMKQEHYKALELALSTVRLPANRTFEGMKEEYMKEGLTARRFRFDCLYAIPTVNRNAWFDLGIYDYLNDDHIHTALKQIVS